MADAGALLKFPGGKPSRNEKVCEVPPVPCLPAMDSFTYEETVELYQIAISVKRKAEDLVKFVDDNRAAARQAGIEILAVQVNSTLEGDRFQRVMDALEDAVYRRSAITLTREGADKVHRLEKLISEADNFIVSFMNGKKIDPQLGQSTSPYPTYAIPMGPTQSDVSKWMPVIIVGIAGIVGIIAILALTQKQRNV